MNAAVAWSYQLPEPRTSNARSAALRCAAGSGFQLMRPARSLPVTTVLRPHATRYSVALAGLIDKSSSAPD
jgi:hypothetical protein